MAKVKQFKMRLELDPSRPYLETVVNINYDSTDSRTATYNKKVPEADKRFYINLPEIVAGVLGFTRAYGKDQDEVLARFKEALVKFKNTQVETHKVILYRINVEPKPGDNTKYSSGDRRVDVWAGVFNETIATGGNGLKRYSYEPLPDNVNFSEGNSDSVLRENSWVRCGEAGKQFLCQIPYTEQNVGFFLWIKERLTELIARLHELEDSTKLIEEINSGRLLPLGNTSSATPTMVEQEGKR